MKKPFKETKLGKILLGAKDIAEDILPDNGVLGIIKNILDADDSLTPEERETVLKQAQNRLEQEVKDRDSARVRQVGMANAGKTDFLFNLTGLVGLASFTFAIYAIVYIPDMQENDLFIHLLGMLEGIVVSNLFAYYFGTSKESSNGKRF
jgi:hypothetical protein